MPGDPDVPNTPDVIARLDRLEARLEEVTMVQDVVLRLLSTTRPLARVLEQFGATETQEQAFFHLLDGMAQRARGPVADRPSFGYFEMRVTEVFPERRGDHEFIQLLIDTLKVERLAYRELYAHMIEQGWPSWP